MWCYPLFLHTCLHSKSAEAGRQTEAGALPVAFAGTKLLKFLRLETLEPVCCKKQQKKVPDQLLVCGIGDLWRTWMIPNWLHMSPSDSPDHPGSIYYHLQRSHIPQTSNWSGTVFCCFLQQTGSKVSFFGQCSKMQLIPLQNFIIKTWFI